MNRMSNTTIRSSLNLVVLCLLISFSHSFSIVSYPIKSSTSISSQMLAFNLRNKNMFPKNTMLSMGFLEDVGSSLFGGGKKEEEEVVASSVVDASIPTRVIEMNASNIKVGGLRFTLGLIFMSLQNQPEPNTWKANQSDEGALDMYFLNDNTAMISIQMSDKSITMDRYGATPSLAYMLQESLLLHSILDELEGLAFGVEGEDDDVKDENRLIVFSEDEKDAISLAREALPARKA